MSSIASIDDEEERVRECGFVGRDGRTYGDRSRLECQVRGHQLRQMDAKSPSTGNVSRGEEGTLDGLSRDGKKTGRTRERPLFW